MKDWREKANESESHSQRGRREGRAPPPARLRPGGSWGRRQAEEGPQGQPSVHPASHDSPESPLLRAWQGVSEGPASPLLSLGDPCECLWCPRPCGGCGHPVTGLQQAPRARTPHPTLGAAPCAQTPHLTLGRRSPCSELHPVLGRCAPHCAPHSDAAPRTAPHTRTPHPALRPGSTLCSEPDPGAGTRGRGPRLRATALGTGCEGGGLDRTATPQPAGAGAASPQGAPGHPHPSWR